MVPRTVDHDQRRTHLAESLVRVAARDGLHAVTMRSVAVEAGVSLRLVQYYFHSKAELLHGALTHLERQSHQRWANRLAALPTPRSTRDFVEAFLAEALPTDAPSRAFHLLGASYAVLAMTDRELADQPFIAGITHLEHQLADALRHARNDGELPTRVNAEHEATRLVALAHGLGTMVLIGQRAADDAITVLRYHVDQLFSGCL